MKTNVSCLFNFVNKNKFMRTYFFLWIYFVSCGFCDQSGHDLPITSLTSSGHHLFHTSHAELVTVNKKLVTGYMKIVTGHVKLINWSLKLKWNWSLKKIKNLRKYLIWSWETGHWSRLTSHWSCGTGHGYMKLVTVHVKLVKN